jgi:hypothetical protein
MFQSQFHSKKLIIAAALAGAAATASTMSGCTKSAPSPSEVVSQSQAAQLHQDAIKLRALGDTAGATSKDQQAADQYARLGELLLMPEGIEYADQMFAQAIAADPNNAKANFYKAQTEPLMTLRGYLPRIERLVVSEQDNKALEKLRMDIEKLHMPEVSKNSNQLPDGEKPFTTYYDVQRFAREKLLPAFQASVDKLSKIDVSKSPLQLNFTPARLQLKPVTEYNYSYTYQTCANDPTTGWTCTDYSYSGTYRNGTDRNLFFVDKYDLKAIRSSFLAMVDSIRLSSAYSGKDSEFALRRLKAIDAIRRDSGLPGLTAEDVVDTLNEFPSLFTLEPDQQLAPIAVSSAEAVTHALELAALRDQLCNGTARTDDNSVIHPICIEADAVDALKLGSNLLAGPAEVTLGKDSSGNAVKIVTDLAGTLKNPAKDLKTLLPTSFDDAGNPVDYPDATMGGLFPNGDFVSKMQQLGSTQPSVMNVIRSGVNHVKDHI